MSAVPGAPLRVSTPRCAACQSAFDEFAERTNRVLMLLQLQIKVLQAQIAAVAAAPEPALAPTGLNITRGSFEVIDGKRPGGPSPIPPYITPHAMIVGEGSKQALLLTFLDGQVPIGATGADPAAANITGSSASFTTPYGVGIKNGPNTITLGLVDSLLTWISAIGVWSLTVVPPGPGPWTPV